MNKNTDINNSITNLNGDENETLDELKARLAKHATLAASGDPEAMEQMAKSLNRSVSNFLRCRGRREQPLAKSLRPGLRLVLPVRSSRGALKLS